jgi:hypothetical protein
MAMRSKSLLFGLVGLVIVFSALRTVLRRQGGDSTTNNYLHADQNHHEADLLVTGADINDDWKNQQHALVNGSAALQVPLSAMPQLLIIGVQKCGTSG